MRFTCVSPDLWPETFVSRVGVGLLASYSEGHQTSGGGPLFPGGVGGGWGWGWGVGSRGAAVTVQAVNKEVR